MLEPNTVLEDLVADARCAGLLVPGIGHVRARAGFVGFRRASVRLCEREHHVSVPVCSVDLDPELGLRMATRPLNDYRKATPEHCREVFRALAAASWTNSEIGLICLYDSVGRSNGATLDFHRDADWSVRPLCVSTRAVSGAAARVRPAARGEFEIDVSGGGNPLIGLSYDDALGMLQRLFELRGA